MVARGQMALDLLLGLLVLLIVLNAFSVVLDRFEETQKEVSIRQQVRENILLTQLLVTYSAAHSHDISTYPASNGPVITPTGPSLPNLVNTFTRSPGEVSLSTVRALNYPSGIVCTGNFFLLDPQTLVARVDVLGGDVGQTTNIQIDQNISIRRYYDTNHILTFDGCFGKILIEAAP